MADDRIVNWRQHLRIDIPVLLVMTALFVFIFKIDPSMQHSGFMRTIAMLGMAYFFGKFIWGGSYMIGAFLTTNYKLAWKLLFYACLMVTLMFVSIRLIVAMLELV